MAKEQLDNAFFYFMCQYLPIDLAAKTVSDYTDISYFDLSNAVKILKGLGVKKITPVALAKKARPDG